MKRESWMVGANFRPPHFAYERRSATRGYPTVPPLGAPTALHSFESPPVAPPRSTPLREEIKNDELQTNHDYDDEMK